MPLLPCRQQAKVIETLPGDHSSISVFDATLVQSDPLPVFLVDGSTDAGEAFTTLIELCFGMGIGTIGCQAAGVVPVRAAYGSLPMVEAYRSMHPEVPCIHGDVSSQETIQCLYKAHPKPAVKMCGVSSRPFSSGGYQRGADDQSSNTLPAALRAGYMLRAIALVLEGVQDAATNSMVRQQVDTFQDQRGYPLNETTWHLAQGVQCRSVHQTQSVACLDHVTCCRLRLNFSALPWRLLYIDGFYASGIWHNRLGGYLTCSCI